MTGTEHTRRLRSGFSVCDRCGSYINLVYGEESPGSTEGCEVDGKTYSTAREPGDHDDICAVCDYGSRA